jgi:hypothetical protein
MPQYDSTISTVLRAICSRVTTFWREGHHQAAKDCRARWRRGALWLLAVICVTLLIYTLTLVISNGSGDFYLGGNACQPDGSFSVDPAAFRYWSSSGFFQITLGFGSMSFTQVKVIDVAWDVVSD